MLHKVTVILCLIVAALLVAVDAIVIESDINNLRKKRHDGYTVDMGFLVNFLSDMKSERKEQQTQYEKMQQLVEKLSKKTTEFQQQSDALKKSVKDMKSKNGQIQDEITALKNITARQANVAFYIWLANENTVHSKVIKYDRVVTNMGNGYSVSTGRFVAPVSGTYVFTVTVSDKYGLGHAHLDIMKNDIEVGTVRSERSRDMDLGSQVVVLTLKASDKVYIKNRGNHGLNTYKGRFAYNTFSGFLIRSYV